MTKHCRHTQWNTRQNQWQGHIQNETAFPAELITGDIALRTNSVSEGEGWGMFVRAGGGGGADEDIGRQQRLILQYLENKQLSPVLGLKHCVMSILFRTQTHKIYTMKKITQLHKLDNRNKYGSTHNIRAKTN